MRNRKRESSPGLLRLGLGLLGPRTEALQSLEHGLALLEHGEHVALDGLLPAPHLELALLLAHLLHQRLLPPALPPPRELDLALAEPVHPPIVQRVRVKVPHVHPVRGELALLH